MNIPIELVDITDRRFISRDPATPDLLKVLGVDPKWAEHIRVLDRQGNLVLLHYISTLTSPEGQVDEEPFKEIGHVRGVIIDTSTNKVICRSFNYTPEVVSTNANRLVNLLPDLTNKYFYRGCEGTVIRLYNFEGEWRISTHRKINAERSYWAGPTFGELFNKLRKFEFENLETEKCYIFLLSDDSNRLVYTVPTDGQLLLLGVYNRETDDFMDTNNLPDLSGVSKPEKINIKDHEQLHLMVNDTNAFNKAGIIVFDSPTSNKPIKVVNDFYYTLRKSRGNEPNLRARYIHVRGTVECNILRSWFTDESYQTVFNNVELEINELVKVLHSMYIHRYIKKNFDTLPKEEFVVLQRCHTWHSQDRGSNIVTKDKVREFIDTTPGHYLLTMLNRKRKQEKKEQKELAQTVETEMTS